MNVSGPVHLGLLGNHVYCDDHMTAEVQQPGLQHQVHNGARARWQISLLRCLCKHKRGRSTRVTVYRKPTHTDQYLNFSSNHHIQHKSSVVRTLMRRAEVMVTRPDCRRKEMAHVQDALKTNGYRQRMFKVPRPKQQQSTTPTGTRPKTNVGLPYMQGTSEALTRVFKAHGVGTYHRPINTIRSILVHPKDKTPDALKCGLVYQVECPECPLTYIGETGRTLATRIKTISTSGTH